MKYALDSINTGREIHRSIVGSRTVGKSRGGRGLRAEIQVELRQDKSVGH